MYTKFPLLCTPLCQHATHLSSKWLISFLKCSLLTSIDHMWHVLSQYVNKVHPPFDKIPKTIYNILPFSSTFFRKINFELWNSYNHSIHYQKDSIHNSFWSLQYIVSDGFVYPFKHVYKSHQIKHRNVNKQFTLCNFSTLIWTSYKRRFAFFFLWKHKHHLQID